MLVCNSVKYIVSHGFDVLKLVGWDAVQRLDRILQDSQKRQPSLGSHGVHLSKTPWSSNIYSQRKDPDELLDSAPSPGSYVRALPK